MPVVLNYVFNVGVAIVERVHHRVVCIRDFLHFSLMLHNAALFLTIEFFLTLFLFPDCLFFCRVEERLNFVALVI